MGKKKFTDAEIAVALKEYENGKSIAEICEELDISKQTFQNWNKKYGGVESQCIKQLKELKENYTRLQKMYSDLATDHRMLKEVITKNL